jgi:ubiquinone/menaquinone biosynthesis C-methylase UbiE
MNSNHARVCPSPEWAERLQTLTLPAVTAGIDLGQRMLEVGPGPGAATDWLRHRVGHLTSVEIEAEAADALRTRFAGSNVEIVSGDATALPWPDATFDSVASFTMLHHVATVADQNRVLAELLRVLRPGGALVGSDSLPSDDLHHFHVEDTYNPIEPGTLLTRLQTLGFERITVSTDGTLRFSAHKPAA